jgi:hypothetical protein
MDFSAAVEALYRLNTGVIDTDSGRHERPHKPVMLLAVFDAIAAGPIQQGLAVSCSFYASVRRRALVRGALWGRFLSASPVMMVKVTSETLLEVMRILTISLGSMPAAGRPA